APASDGRCPAKRIRPPDFLLRSIFDPLVLAALNSKKGILNSELVKQALAKVGNPNVLVNLVSRRVRQLTSGGGEGRPLLADVGNSGAGDIALMEIIEDKMSFNLVESGEEVVAVPKKRKRS
ncbi:MAG: DNA-directed RNA polymerase subunit omega, partial [Verrucomicrobiota bacterium]